MADIDIQAIRDAIARRQGGGASPVISQMSGPGAQLPTGGSNVPVPSPQPAPPTPSLPTGSLPPAQAPQGAQGATAGQPSKLKQVGNFDDETKALAKQLITKLMATL
jgi:hypothetical protein